MDAGAKSEEMRYDLRHEYIALDPDARSANCDTPITNRPTIQPPDRFGTDGHVVKGTCVASKPELLGLLKDWLEMFDVPTIGNIGAFGGSQCIFISPDKDQTAVLNAEPAEPQLANMWNTRR